MHYEEYCKARGVHQASPFATRDFYQELNRIAESRATVLADIDQMTTKKLSALYEVVQRCVDILLSCLGMLVGALPFFVIAVAIKIDSRGPVFYRQARVGKGGQVFQMVKFRTMLHNAEQVTGPVWAMNPDPRATRVGTFLRKVKLDELPQLFNILKGEMGFVGPRPERPEFVYRFVQDMPAFDRRHEVKPGIAGFAQLMSGYDNSAESIYRKLRWDVRYIQKKSLKTDFCVLCRTVIAVLRGKV